MNGLDSAVEKTADAFNSTEVTVTENGKEELKGTLREYGYSADTSSMKSEANERIQSGLSSFSQRLKSINSGIAITLKAKASVNTDVFQDFVRSESFATPRVASSEGAVSYDDSVKKYVVADPVQGNEIDDSVLQEAVKSSIDKALEDDTILSGVTVEVPDDAYISDDISASKSADQLRNEADALNQYVSSRIDYQFGSETVTLDASTFKDWLTYNEQDNSVAVSNDAVTKYVISLKAKYDTRYKTRTFTATGGKVITFPGGDNEYGYTISQDKEIAQLKEDLASGKVISREPVYAATNSYGNPVYYKRNGTDDLAGNYVEVDMTKQHVWFYKDGALAAEGDCVTGDVSKDRGTKTGVFPLAYKESPSVLSSQVNGYEENVNYWMPFYDGQGLHDAPWRSSFGGSIYNGSGSHGCVNLPENLAAAIYNNITSGTAIILYYEN